MDKVCLESASFGWRLDVGQALRALADVPLSVEGQLSVTATPAAGRGETSVSAEVNVTAPNLRVQRVQADRLTGNLLYREGRVIVQLREKMQRVVTQVFRLCPNRIETSYEEPLAIADAMIGGDGARAADLIVRHLELGKRLILSPRG